jgi:hypothetical protein
VLHDASTQGHRIVFRLLNAQGELYNGLLALERIALDDSTLDVT